MPNERTPETKAPKKEYCPPNVLHIEKLTASATSCARQDSTCVSGGQTGPLQS